VLKIFIGWSGKDSASHRTAEALKVLIERQSHIEIDVFVSSEDIQVGDYWFPAVFEAASNADLGIFCITPDRANSAWIHYEAGLVANGRGASGVKGAADGKGKHKSKIVPLLLGGTVEEHLCNSPIKNAQLLHLPSLDDLEHISTLKQFIKEICKMSCAKRGRQLKDGDYDSRWDTNWADFTKLCATPIQACFDQRRKIIEDYNWFERELADLIAGSHLPKEVLRRFDDALIICRAQVEGLSNVLEFTRKLREIQQNNKDA